MFQRRFLGASFLRIIVAHPSCPQLSSVSQGAMQGTSATSDDSAEQPVDSGTDTAEQPAKVRKLPSADNVAQSSCPQLSSEAQGTMQCTSAALADSGEQPVHTEVNSAEQPASIPIIEVAFKNGMWWSLPDWMSRDLYEKFEQRLDAGYIWDWREPMTGSWVNEGEETSINRMRIQPATNMIDFIAKQQKNIDTCGLRTIRVAWVSPADVEPRWTGQKIS